MRPALLAALAPWLLLTTPGCRTARAVERAAADVLISDAQEAQLGLQVHRQLVQEGTLFVEDRAVLEGVAAVAGPVLQAADRARPGVTWRLAVLDQPGVVNAFATPGGYVYVCTGLLLAAKDEAELAGVLAHEAGHVVARHAARQWVSAFGLEAITALALGRNPALLPEVAAAVAAQGALLAHSRADESESDALAVRFSSAAGYDPLGLARFFGRLLQQERGSARLPTWLSTHPATEDRVREVTALVQRAGLAGRATVTGRLPSLQQQVRALPARPAPVR